MPASALVRGRECSDADVTDLQALVGQIDIYLFDQLLRGRIPAGTRICDAGCGSGRRHLIDTVAVIGVKA